MNDSAMVGRFLEVIENTILPMTKEAVKEGHNIFGGAVLNSDDLSLVVAGTNRRGVDPTLHGEMVTIHNFFKEPDHPDPAETIFLATHEPCPMCLSALAWSGFRRIYFLFGYDETRDDFRMGDDLRILSEVFYNTVPSRRNSFFRMVPIRSMIAGLPEKDPFSGRISKIKGSYKALSDVVLASGG